MGGGVARGSVRKLLYLAVLGSMAALIALPAVGAESPGRVSSPLLSHLSQSVQVHYYLSHPDQAPAGFRRAMARSPRSRSSVRSAPSAGAIGKQSNPASFRFNHDATGLPQNEESVTVCPNNRKVLLEGANDYRGLLDQQSNFTGWYLSTNGGASVAKEGLLPSADLNGTQTPSGGDPVEASDGTCNLYAGSLAYNPTDPMGATPNGIVVYRTNLSTLLSPSCGDAVDSMGLPSMSDPDCWPTAVPVAQTVGGSSGHMFDKEWIAVGNTGDGVHVWITYSDFTLNSSTPLGFSQAQVFAVRCNPDLTGCTAPILISSNDNDVAFSYVTIGPDGRTYVTWAGVQGELQQQPQTFTPKMRIAPAGSTTFGPEETVTTLDQAIGFNTLLHADDFRVATGPKNDVTMIHGHPREFVVFDTCGTRVAGAICEHPRIVLAVSDDDGATWSFKRLSKGGDNYFPTLSVDRRGGRLAVAWYTSRFDPFGHRQDIELVDVNPGSLKVVQRSRVTTVSNEPDADYALGGVFIGDYIQMTALAGVAYIGFNANYTRMPLLATGSSLNQQDNYLMVEPLK